VGRGLLSSCFAWVQQPKKGSEGSFGFLVAGATGRQLASSFCAKALHIK